MKQVLHIIDDKDNTAIALADLAPGATVSFSGPDGDREITIRDDIPFGHKVAVKAIANGEHVIKYGETIGAATQDIAPGNHVHTQNLESLRGRGDLVGADQST